MGLLDDDLLALKSDPTFTVAATVGGVSCRGWLDVYDEPPVDAEADASRLGRWVVFTLLTSDKGTVQLEDAVTVDGATYRVRDIRRSDDGKLTRLFLQ